MLIAARLPFLFDAARLDADLDRIEAGGWSPHFNTQYYEGDWSGIPLRSNSLTSALFIDPSRPDAFADLPALQNAKYFREVAAAFEAPVRAVRLLKLAPGAVIREHRDAGLRYEDGEMRVHIPIRTNPGVEFVLGGESLPLLPGECWYLNVDLPHRAANRGTADRVHLVLDLVVNTWVEEILRSEGVTRISKEN
ncbi:MAG TPA: aspartyl/asparaginyl beta-hydroxylase domain-containing protein [Thermoanaerobaculia bacterium]|nr:aspartyl/asparaginyl beta-hydroxylase domain-containing protein [Thermoanaerobaculia bacterium]